MFKQIFQILFFSSKIFSRQKKNKDIIFSIQKKKTSELMVILEKNYN